MCTDRRRPFGQALIETLVAASVLVPLGLLVVLLGKYQSMQTATIAASRSLAFECTVRPGDCADAAAHAGLTADVQRRHFGRIDREVLSDDRLSDASPVDERNALWVDRRGRPLLERFSDIDISLSAPRFDAGRSTAMGRASSAAATALDRLAGPSRFGLSMAGGMIEAQVRVRVSPSEVGNEALGRLDSLPLTMRSRTVVLTDGWHASGPYGAEVHSVRSRVVAGSRLDPLHEARFVLGYQLTRWSVGLMDLAGLEPSAHSFRAHETDVDRVPTDRIGR